jgi:hypothetical protein
MLFQFLFPEPILEFFKGSHSNSINKDNKIGLRIRLEVNKEDVRHIPWEFIYDEKYLQRYLCTGNTTLLTRYHGDLDLLKTELNRVGKRINGTIKIKGLFICSNGLGDQFIDPEEEYESISGKIKRDGNSVVSIECCKAQSTRWEAVNDELFRGYNLVHFYGHGLIENGEPKLIFTTPNRGGDPIDAQKFSQLFDGQKGRNMCLVFMNACNSAKDSNITPKSGLPEKLIVSSPNSISAIVGMQFPITVNASGTFAQNVYQYMTIEENPIDVAIQRARENFSGSYDHRGTRLFATPVIFLRSKDGFIFDRLIPIQKPPDLEDARIMLASLQTERLKFFTNTDTVDAVNEFWKNNLVKTISFFQDIPYLDEERRKTLDNFANETYLKLVELKNARNEEDRKKTQGDILNQFSTSINFMSSILNMPSQGDRYGKSISRIQTGQPDPGIEGRRSEVEIIAEIHDIWDQIMFFEGAVNEFMVIRSDKGKLTNVARVYQHSISSFNKQLNRLIIDLQKIPSLSEKILYIERNLTHYVDELSRCFSDIVVGIDFLSDVMNNITTEFKKLWQITITTILHEGTRGIVR